MKKIVVISQDAVVVNLVERRLSPSFQILCFRSMFSALDYIYNSVPHLVIVDFGMSESDSFAPLNDLKEDPIFSQIPVLAILPADYPVSRLFTFLVEDYLLKPEMDTVLTDRVNLCLLRAERVVEINPLTRLPGNISINRQIQDRIDRGEIFALGYADLDYFKPLNDKYGFSRGDEVIRVTGRLILSMVKNSQPRGSFTGHIGGDDFIFIMGLQGIENTAKGIIETFDGIIPTFYDHQDKVAGYINSQDRQGKAQRFPFIGLSIGITDNSLRPFQHYGEVTEVASEMKKVAKQSPGSSYCMDRRLPTDDVTAIF
ncbi:MAG TPA: diguanylate cyclase [Syntrophales bacterium]|nr:diguanylate cyclase [Syntrophales bacterium]